MGDWNENARRYKRAQQDDPVERHSLQVRNGAKYQPSRKVLLDRLKAARFSFINAIDWQETHGRDSWLARGFELYRKKYVEALQNCWDAGIDVKA